MVAEVRDHESVAELEMVERLSRDVRAAARMLGPHEARYLVDAYYDLQEQRIRANAQARASGEGGEPNGLLAFIARNFETAETDMRRALQAYAEDMEVGRWSLSIVGIGPVLAAGLMAHIDITRAPTAGAIWSFAGLNPEVRWDKGEKRPWNARLKTLCWKIGESFTKQQNRDTDVYGHIFAERKELEQARNERGDFREQAERSLAERKYRDGTVAREWYDQGKLPPARIHLRAQRYAVKLFLAHWHHVAYESLYHEPPPKPYILTHPEHTHYIAPPNWPMQT